jgi:Yip1 domain
MDIVTRAKNICLTPNTEWPVIASEPTTSGTLISGYVVPLAAIGAVAGLIGGSIVGYTVPFLGTYRVPITAGLVSACFTFAAAIAGVFILGFIINALAPTFGAEANNVQALKVAVYSYTPAWVAGALNILPMLSLLGILAALYGLYLLYLGLQRVMKCPQDKAVGYTAVVIVCAVVLAIVVSAVGGAIVGAGMVGRGMMGGGLGASSSSEVKFDNNSTMGKLQALSARLDESNKKMEAAQKSGDEKAEVAAAMEGLGTLLGGGKRVDPIGLDQLKPFVPETFAGLPKTSGNAEKSGIAGLMVSKAEATYSDTAGRSVRLEISDSGGASGLVGLAGWASVQGEKEDDNSAERTAKVDGRLVHEKMAKHGGDNEFSIVLGDRFIVSASSRGVPFNDLKAAVSGLKLAALESLKDAGVQK